jgi:hypothetical protein
MAKSVFYETQGSRYRRPCSAHQPAAASSGLAADARYDQVCES